MTDSASTSQTVSPGSLPRLPAAKSLFSQHYLQARLPEHAEWAADPLPVFETVRPLWERARALGGSWNEAQTEQEFIKPVLDALGWSYIVQAKAQRRGGQSSTVTRPDYALFASQGAADAAYPYQRTDDAFYSRATAIAEAKYWGRPLSQQDSSGRNTWKAESNPSHQMVSYLVGTRCPWGILTNGRTWRLYSREVSSTASEFYEVDLGLIFDFLDPDGGPTPEQLADFKRWWLFFRRDAFLPDARGRSFVQQVRDGSATYARRVSDKLKELVFDEVMPEIAAGFVAYRQEQLGIRAETDESLREIYAAGLSLLYKLLFVLYAEARDLLPMRNPAYREQSLTSLAEWAAERTDRCLPPSDATFATPRYEALLALFRRIDRGDPSLGIPRYDGGLFSAATPENRFLERHKLSDRAVARAVDIMVRDAGEPVDYTYISVRNLGTIYEGLLENRLVVSDRDAISPQRWHLVQLVNDRGERKLSGSYYTPDFIVEYNVSQTLDPILDARAARFTAAMGRIADLHKKLRNAVDTTTNQRLQMQLADAERDALEAFLGIKVCDSAMGSGHFLVNTVDHLTDGIIRRMQVYHDTHPDVPWDWNPIQRLIERVRREIAAEMARQGIVVDPARLDDTALLTRLVMKRCIYGVDLNPLAVELAKLSLWLHTFTVGAPLSFLDHHLRWGNSVIGADVRTVERAMRGEAKESKATVESRRLAEARGEAPAAPATITQFGLFQGPFAGLLDLTAVMIEVAERADSTLADVQQSAEAYSAFQRQLLPYKQALDLWVSQWFDDERPSSDERPSRFPKPRRSEDAVEFMTMHSADVLPALRGEIGVDERYGQAIARARGLWERQRFFHWDLEFPEVFIDLAGRDWAADGGFDAMIGNPPYVRQEALAPLKPFLAANFAEAYHGVADLSTYFLVQGLRLLRQNGRLGYITSGTFRRLNSGEALRQYLVERSSVEELISLGEQQVFADATTYPIILTLKNSLPSRDHTVIVRQVDDVAELIKREGGERYPAPVGNSAWVFANMKLRHVVEGWSGARPLGDVLGRPIYRGVSTGLNDAFVVDESTRVKITQIESRSADLIKPYARGEDLRRWYQRDSECWLLFVRRGIDITAYPAVEAYLRQFRERLEPRPGDWQGSEWLGRKPGAYQWYEIQDAVEYYPVFESPRLHSTKVSLFPMFSLSEISTYAGNTSYVLPLSDIAVGYYLLGLLNSHVSEYFCRSVFSPKANGYYEVQPGELARFPIPDAPPADRDAIAALAFAITEQARARYTVHHKTRHRLLTDLAAPGAVLNQKLTAWWELDFAGFLAEVRKALKREIPVRQRDDWEEWLLSRRAEHAQYTAEIVRLETALNARVYDLFDLGPAEVRVIEESTKYRYGEV